MSAPERAIGRGSDDWVERVRAASDLVDVVGQSVALRKVGRNWVGLCPFHAEKTPSFSVHAERQFYHCFSCKAGGDVFKFVMETEKIGFIEAVEALSRRAGIPVPERRSAGRGGRAPLLEALEQAAAAYEQWLADPTRGASTRAYLERRGLGRDTIKSFRLGLAPDGWENLSGKLRGGFSEEVLIEAGLAMRREGGARGGVYDRFRNRLMVPLVAVGGSVVGFGARALGDESPKYLNSPETPVYHKGAFLFGLDAARKADGAAEELVVVEGYFDAIALHQAGVANTVATSGTALTAEQAKLIKRVSAGVALTYDGDDAGREAMLRSLGVLLGEGLEVAIVDLPQGEDPDTLVREHGRSGWQAARGAAYDPVEFIQRHVLRTAGSGDPKERALQAVVALAAGTEDPVRETLLLERAARVFGFSGRVLARAVQLKRGGRAGGSDAGKAGPLGSAVHRGREGEHRIERAFLRALLMAPEASSGAWGGVTLEDFADAACLRVATWLRRGSDEPPDDEATASLVRELLVDAPEGFDWEAEARGAARRLVERRLRRELREREEALRKTGEADEASRLMEEIQAIARSLHERTA
jgi:DNA primase